MSEHQPSSDNFNQDQPATSDDFLCEQCDEPITGRGLRFCSRDCHVEWVRENGRPPKRKTREEMEAEMQDVFARLQSYDEEETS